MMPKVSKVPAQAIQAFVRAGRLMIRSCAPGRVRQRDGANAGQPVPRKFADLHQRRRYSQQQALQVVLAIAVKTISNYTNHLFDTPVDAAFASYVLPAGTK